jgi:hypothetical protein
VIEFQTDTVSIRRYMNECFTSNEFRFV